MKKIICFILLLASVQLVKAQNKINQYEYWFDADFANKTTTTITPVENYNLNTNISTALLNTGLHVIHFRFRDVNSKYSSVISQFFYKQNNTVGVPTPLLTQYEYWFDNNYAAKVSSNFSGTNTNENVINAISTNSLVSGLHTFHIRFKDNAGKWSSTLSQFFYKQNSIVGAPTPLLTQYEYWFDNNYASKVSSNFSGTNTNENIINAISTNSLVSGLHTFHIRFKDNAGKWSSTLSQFFYKQNIVAGSPTPLLTQYEYWFDNNYAAKVSSNFSGTNANENVINAVSTNSLVSGLHTFHIRFKDNAGKWSSTLSQFFYKQNITSGTANPLLTEYEYWFDNNYTDKVLANFTGTNASENLISTIGTSTVNTGLHAIHIRFKDNAGKWSSTLSQFFYKMPETISGTNKITAYRYWIDMNDANIITQTISAPVNHFNLIENIDLTRIWKGQHDIHFQFKDERGMWSSVLTEVITKDPLPIAEFTANKLQVCVGEVVSFTSTSTDGDTHLWDFNNGNTSLDSLTTTTYTVAGTYVVSLTVNDAATLKDSMITKTIVVNDLPTASFSYVVTNQNVSFTNTSTNATTYTWDFGDGNNSSSANTNHIFSNAGGTFTVQLKAENDCGASISSQNILIEPSSVESTKENVSDLIIFPNPTNGKLYIDLYLNSNSKLNVRILDYTSKLVDTINSDDRETGLHHLWYDTSTLASGMYFIEVNSNSFYSIKRIVVNH